MADLYIYLGGQWPSSIRLDNGEDHILLGPGQSAPHNSSRVISTRKLSEEQSRSLAEQYIEGFNRLKGEAGSPLVECFLNDYFSYTLKVVFSFLVTLNDCLKHGQYSNIYIVSSKTDTNYPPMLGFQTTESKRGSRSFFGAYLANVIPEVFFNTEFKKITVPGDVFCRQKVRETIIASANKFFCMMLLSRLLLLRYKSKRKPAHDLKNVIIVRNWHQARFAKIFLINGGGEFSFIIFPQSTQGSLSALSSCLRMLEEKAAGVYFNARDLFDSLKSYRRDLKKLEKLKGKFVGAESISLGGVTLTYSPEGLLREVMLSTVVILYKNLLEVALRKRRAKKLINFELVGRMAGLEALAARQCDIETHSIQTALISSTPHPVFPFADSFYADGLITKKLIENIGVIRKGKVVFEGGALELIDMKSSSEFKLVAFFTQPYETAVTLKILSTLSKWAERSEARVLVKLHPRDSLESYKGLSSKTLQFVYEDVEDVVMRSDVVVTRTSSVAKESIARGTPVILARWSDMDKNVKADYMVDDLLRFYSSETPARLEWLLDNSVEVVRCANYLQERIFAGKTAQDLIKKVSS